MQTCNMLPYVLRLCAVESLIPDLTKVLKTGSVGISRDQAHSIFEGLQHGVEAEAQKKSRRGRSKITRQNLFKLGVILFLRGKLNVLEFSYSKECLIHSHLGI